MISKGLLIESSALATDLIIWTWRQGEVLEALARLGYPVSTMPSQAMSST